MVTRNVLEFAEDAQKVLEQVEQGAITVTVEATPTEIFAGDVTYRFSNGWTMIVFNDCGDWDYIDRFVDLDGNALTFEDCLDGEGGYLHHLLVSYQPSEDVLRDVYQWTRP